jgi:tetratricopeptide (TPR) repeat protein
MKALLSTIVMTVALQPLWSQSVAVGPAAPEPATDLIFSFGLSPAASIPIYYEAVSYAVGGGGTLSGFVSLPFFQPVAAGVEVGYGLQPVSSTQLFLSSIGGGVLARGTLTLGPLAITPFASGGYFFAIESDGTIGRSMYASGGLELSFQLTENWAVGAQASYSYYFGLRDALNIGAVVIWTPQGVPGFKPFGGAAAKPAPVPLNAESGAPAVGKSVTITQAALNPVFPVFYKYYDDHSLGSVVVQNTQKTALNNMRVSFMVNEYMDNPKVCAVKAKLDPGAELSVDLVALFNDNMMEITEATKLSAKVSVDYESSGTAVTEEFTDTLRVYDRNASMWDDDRRTAAFVTSKDPSVLSFSKNVLTMVKGQGSTALNKNLTTAMAIHEALRLYGISYAVDPSSSYSESSKNKTAVDFLQFPRQTLEYRAGDCDDLSILYCALLESLGIETALITIPGHIFMAVSLGITPERAATEIPDAGELIVSGASVWIPIEVTDRSGDFLAAWQTGAKEWRENAIGNKAVLYPVHEAWTLYESVAYPGEAAAAKLPDQQKVVDGYLAVLNKYIDRAILPQVTLLQNQIKQNNSPADLVNKLGALYARYGFYDKAEAQFTQALKAGEYTPALVNMGNLRYIAGKPKDALAFYQRAIAKTPGNANALLGLARVNSDLENFGAAKEAYEELKKVDPALAERFAYLGLSSNDAKRAASVEEMKGVTVWPE